MESGKCISCQGTGRGTFGGPCNNCAGKGYTNAFEGFMQYLVGLIILGIILLVIVAS